MSAESLTIIATGIALAALMVTSLRSLKTDIKADIKALDARLGGVERPVDTLSERMARMEGKMDLLLQGLQIRITPKEPPS